MTGDELRALQAPLKDCYRRDPAAAQAILRATGVVNFDRLMVTLTSRPETPGQPGMHPMAGGDGTCACAAEMLLEALVGCAGVTLAAVCTAMSIPVSAAEVTAEGLVDFRGTLGVSRDVPVGFTGVVVSFRLNSSATDEQLAKAAQLAERYCVVAQTLKQVDVRWERFSA